MQLKMQFFYLFFKSANLHLQLSSPLTNIFIPAPTTSSKAYAHLWQNLLIVIRQFAGCQRPGAWLTLEDVDFERGIVIAAPLAVVVDVLQWDAGRLGDGGQKKLEDFRSCVDLHDAGVKVTATTSRHVWKRNKPNYVSHLFFSSSKIFFLSFYLFNQTSDSFIFYFLFNQSSDSKILVLMEILKSVPPKLPYKESTTIWFCVFLSSQEWSLLLLN